MSDARSAAYLKYTELDPAVGISALDLIAFHRTSLNKTQKITAADLGVAPLIAVDLSGTVTTSGTESWYNVTGTSTITLDTDPDGGDLVRVTLDGVTSVAMVGTINGQVDPNLLGDTNSYDLVFAETASEWKIV